MSTKSSICGVATSENTTFGDHEWNKIRSYIKKKKKIKCSVSFMLLFTIIIFSRVDPRVRKLSTFASEKISNDQELIQSDPISCPQNQKGNN